MNKSICAPATSGQAFGFVGVAALLVAAAMAGCSDKPAACSDESTVNTVKAIYRETMEKTLSPHPEGTVRLAEAAAATVVEVRAIRTTAPPDQVGKVTCEAQLSVTVPIEAAALASNPMFLALNQTMARLAQSVNVTKDRIEASVQYTSQMTDDKKQVMVTTQGVEPIGRFIAILAGNGGFKRESEPAPSAATAQHNTDAAHPVEVQEGSTYAGPATATAQVNPVTSVSKPASTTRFGAVSITDDQNVLFKGMPLSPKLEGRGTLSVREKIEVGNSDLLLIEEVAGSACPALYYFVRTSAAGAAATPSFGTCSDEIKVSRDGERVSISMPGFQGQFESKEAQTNAAKEAHVFAYESGTVKEAIQPSANSRRADELSR